MEQEEIRKIYRELWLGAVSARPINEWSLRPASTKPYVIITQIGMRGGIAKDGRLVITNGLLRKDVDSSLQVQQLRNTVSMLLARMYVGDIEGSQESFLRNPNNRLVANAFGYDDEVNDLLTPKKQTLLESNIEIRD